MFIREKSYLLEKLTKMQRRRCQYDPKWLSSHAVGDAPEFCDCKYGFSEIGEQTGCPELRCIVELLSLMTEKEFAIVMKRGKHTIS